MKNKQMPLRPISNIVRKHAKASFQIGTFKMSEGYELIRTCFDSVIVRYNTATHGSAAFAPAQETSIEKGKAFIKDAHQKLIDAGFTAVIKNELEIEITNN